jgi:hypothetical protein
MSIKLVITSQATRKGWPYYTRPLHQRHGTIVYSRATPCGWPARGGGGLRGAAVAWGGLS